MLTLICVVPHHHIWEEGHLVDGISKRRGVFISYSYFNCFWHFHWFFPWKKIINLSIYSWQVQFSSLSHVFATPWTAACQASLSINNSQRLFKLISIELVMPSNHLILCHPLLLPPSIFPSMRVFSNESALCIRWPRYWSFSFNTSPSNEYSGLISFVAIAIYNQMIWVR